MTMSRAVSDHAEVGANQTVVKLACPAAPDRGLQTPVALFCVLVFDDRRRQCKGTRPDAATELVLRRNSTRLGAYQVLGGLNIMGDIAPI
jgi:hypothetical protein